MTGTISPDVARAAVALRRSHPHAPAREALHVVMRHRTGSLQDFGDIHPTSDFGRIVAEVFDKGMHADDWALIDSPTVPQTVKDALALVWRDDVLPAFARAYGLVI